jgi:hypothetical protein
MAVLTSRGFVEELGRVLDELGTLFNALGHMVTIDQALRQEAVTAQQQLEARAMDVQALAHMLKSHPAEACNNLQVGGHVALPRWRHWKR